MKKNDFAKIQQKIIQKNYPHAIIMFKRLPTNIMYENFDTLMTDGFYKHITKNRNSQNITVALSALKSFYCYSYNSEILWNLLILKLIISELKNDLEVFKEIENKIFLHELENIINLYNSLSDIAKNSHKGIELLVHLNQLKLVDKINEYDDEYKKTCSELYVSKIQYFMENSQLRDKTSAIFKDVNFLSEYIIYKVTQETSSYDNLIRYMHIDNSYNDIDHYEVIINYLLETSRRNDLHSTIIHAIEDIYNITHDERLLSIIYLNKKNFDLSNEVIEQQMYFEYELIGDYEKVYEITSKNIKNFKHDYCSYLFNLKSSILISRDNSELEDKLVLRELYQNLKIIFNLSGDKVYHHAYICLRFLEQYRLFRWSKLFSTYIIAYLDKFSETDLNYFNHVYSFDGNFNPNRLLISKNRKYDHIFVNCLNYYKILNNHCEDFDLNIDNTASWLNLVKYYRADIVDIKPTESLESILDFHFNYVYINKLIHVKKIDEAVACLVKWLVDRTQFYNLHPFDEVFDLVVNDDFSNPVYKLIILYYKIYAYDSEDNEERDLISKARVLLETILQDYEINKIDEFCSEYAYIDKKILYFFLYFVWQTEFMRNTLIYESIDEIQEERINICKKLISLDTTEKQKYIAELQERIKNLEINKISNLLHSSKVFVDINSVKRVCLDRLDKSFESFKQLISNSKNEQSTFFIVRDSNTSNITEVESIEEIDLESSKVFNVDGYIFKAHKIDQRSLLKFKDIISDVTNEFLMGATGLNSYLSTGIRHGILRNTWRNPIEKEQLLPSLLYGNFSNKIVDALPESERIFVYEKLQSFSDGIDLTIDFVTERLIQISTGYEYSMLYSADSKFSEQSVNLNVFNYIISFDDVTLLMQKGKSDLPTFIDDLINLLWLKTDECLYRMRSILDTDIKIRFREIFQELTESIIALRHSEQSDLINSIVSAESNFFKTFQETQQWFNKNNVYQLPELPLSRCVEISKNIISKTIFGLNEWGGPIFTINDDPYLSGRYVSDLVYVFLDLFNNAYQHSKLDPNELLISLDIQHNEDQVSILFENNLYLPMIELDKSLTKLEEIRESIRNNKSKELAQRDSNSGLHKINNRICNTLLFSDTSLDFYIDEKKEKFIIKIEFRINRS